MATSYWITGWREGPVDQSREHMELRYGAVRQGAWHDWLPVARVAPPVDGVVTVEFLVDKDDAGNADLIAMAVKQVKFYLIDYGKRANLGGFVPWEYASYHCGTMSNMYSQIHWSHFHYPPPGTRPFRIETDDRATLSALDPSGFFRLASPCPTDNPSPPSLVPATSSETQLEADGPAARRTSQQGAGALPASRARATWPRRRPEVRPIAAASLRWVRRIAVAGIVLTAAVLSILLLRETMTRHGVRATYPPPGRMVSLPTHAVHLNCVGAGTPTVVLESDLDQLGSLSWDRVQVQVASFARVCSYDRAGIMWSEPGPLPRDGRTIAAELRAVLASAGEAGPYLLVGHAQGGAYVRILAGQDTGAVCGMVLVDSNHPDQYERFAKVGLKKAIPEQGIRPVISLLSQLGYPGRFTGPQYSMPRPVYEAEQAYLPQSSVAWFDEAVETRATLAQAGQVATFGDLPLVVLASARPPSVPTTGFGPDLQGTWLELQRELASLSTKGELRLLEQSGHYPQFDVPEAVVQAIETVSRQCAVGRGTIGTCRGPLG